MKVLQVSVEGLGNGGVQSVMMNIIRNNSQTHFDVLVFTSETRYYDREFLDTGGRIFRIPNYEGKNKFRKKLDYYIRFLRIFIGTYSILKNEKYDVIHCHNELESGICMLAAYFSNVKIRIIHAHTSSNHFRKRKILSNIYKTILQKIMLRFSTIKIGVSEEAYINLFGPDSYKKYLSYIIPNSIDMDRFQKREDTLENTGSINIVNVARFDENKNQIHIIELLPHLIEEKSNIKLQLVGWGDLYKAKIKRRISDLHLENYVEFLPSNTDVRELHEGTDLFIFPSKKEGFGIVLLEAQAMRVPCLVSDTVPKIVDCGLCEFISLSENKQKWSDSILDILNGKKELLLDIEKIKKFDNKRQARFIETLYRGKKYEGCYSYFS